MENNRLKRNILRSKILTEREDDLQKEIYTLQKMTDDVRRNTHDLQYTRADTTNIKTECIEIIVNNKVHKLRKKVSFCLQI